MERAETRELERADARERERTIPPTPAPSSTSAPTSPAPAPAETRERAGADAAARQRVITLADRAAAHAEAREHERAATPGSVGGTSLAPTDYLTLRGRDLNAEVQAIVDFNIPVTDFPPTVIEEFSFIRNDNGVETTFAGIVIKGYLLTPP